MCVRKKTAGMSYLGQYHYNWNSAHHQLIGGAKKEEILYFVCSVADIVACQQENK